MRIGSSAPDFELADQDGGRFRLSEQRGQWLVLVFYPGDETPICTRQLCDYRDGIEAFGDLGARVVGVSTDDAASHRAFRERHKLPFTLLSDPDYTAARLYGCKGFLGMRRGVFMLDAEGLVRYAHVEALALFRRHREELLAVLQGLGGTTS